MPIERSWANIVTVTCLIVVAVIEAYQQALSGAPKVAAVLPRLDGSWNFVPLILLTVAGVFWLIGHFPKRHIKETVPRYESPAAAVIPSVPKNITIPKPDLQPGRVMANISPREFSRLYQDHTSFEADKLVEPYIDTWLSISGTVYNVRISADGTSNLTVDGIDGISLVYCSFGTAFYKQVTICKRGTPVNIRGKIKVVDRTGIQLDECEFF